MCQGLGAKCVRPVSSSDRASQWIAEKISAVGCFRVQGGREKLGVGDGKVSMRSMRYPEYRSWLFLHVLN